MLSHFSRVRLCATPQTAARQAPLSLGCSRQEHWSGLPFPSPISQLKPSHISVQAFLVAQLVKNPPAMQETLHSWVGKIPWRRDRLPTLVVMGFPGGSDGKESSSNAGDLGSIPGSGRSPGKGNGNPLRYSYLENPMDRGAYSRVLAT